MTSSVTDGERAQLNDRILTLRLTEIALREGMKLLAARNEELWRRAIHAENGQNRDWECLRIEYTANKLLRHQVGQLTGLRAEDQARLEKQDERFSELAAQVLDLQKRARELEALRLTVLINRGGNGEVGGKPGDD